MTDPTPVDCYTAQEVFERYRHWYWRGEQERSVHGITEDQAANGLLQCLFWGEIEPLVKDPSTGDLQRITREELGDAAFPERPFYGGDILEPTGRMAKFNGRSMFMLKQQVDQWFANRNIDSALLDKRAAGRPQKVDMVCRVLKAAFPNGPSGSLARKELCSLVREHPLNEKRESVSPDTMGRALLRLGWR
jgi:hypothetical protein